MSKSLVGRFVEPSAPCSAASCWFSGLLDPGPASGSAIGWTPHVRDHRVECSAAQLFERVVGCERGRYADTEVRHSRALADVVLRPVVHPKDLGCAAGGDDFCCASHSRCDLLSRRNRCRALCLKRVFDGRPCEIVGAASTETRTPVAPAWTSRYLNSCGRAARKRPRGVTAPVIEIILEADKRRNDGYAGLSRHSVVGERSRATSRSQPPEDRRPGPLRRAWSICPQPPRACRERAALERRHSVRGSSPRRFRI
jgi:hypothetical protein